MEEKINKFTSQIQYEMKRDNASRFIAEQYITDGFYLHFHRNFELYCVIKGSVYVTVSGESKILTDGQMVFINGLESHSYQVKSSAEIAYLHIGTQYIEPFLQYYVGRRPSRWLLNIEYNKKIYEMVREIIDTGKEMSDLMRTGKSCELLANIILKYGTVEEGNTYLGGETIYDIVQYIYDHFDETLSLKSVAEKFCISPLVLSRKFSKYVKVDFRIFLSDVRVQKVIQMRHKKEYKGVSLLEISSRCGFNSVSTFYRTYKRNFKYGSVKLK